MDDHPPDAEAKMRLSLGLSESTRPVPVADPQRLARQAIRSQAAAREYAERQLVRSEQAIQDLQTRFHAVRREKDAAVAAIRGAQAAQIQAERRMRAVESALLAEKAARESAQREVREARAMIQDLRSKLALANQTVETQQTELQQARTVAEGARRAKTAQATTHTPVMPDMDADEPAGQPVKRKRGRPPGKRDPSVPPRATRKPYATDQEPVQWWTAGWTPRV